MTRNDFLNFYAEGKAEALAEGRAEGLAEGRAEGLAEGRAEGKAEGRAEGQKEKAIEIAGKLIATGMPAKEAANFVGIAEEDL